MGILTNVNSSLYGIALERQQEDCAILRFQQKRLLRTFQTRGHSNNTWHSRGSTKCHVNFLAFVNTLIQGFWKKKSCSRERLSLKWTFHSNRFSCSKHKSFFKLLFIKMKCHIGESQKMAEKVSRIIWMAPTLNVQNIKKWGCNLSSCVMNVLIVSFF